MASRECAKCSFSGDETEFMAVGIDPDGAVYFVHRDTAGHQSALVCGGCSKELIRLSDVGQKVAVATIVLRDEVAGVPDDLLPLYLSSMSAGETGAWVRSAIRTAAGLAPLAVAS